MATDLDDIDKILAQEASNATREEEVLRVVRAFKLNPYEILDLDMTPGAGIAEPDVRKSYRKRSLLIHPDKFKHERGVEAFDLLKKAESELLDAEKRKNLDQTIADARMLICRSLGIPDNAPDTHEKLKHIKPPLKEQIKTKTKEILIDDELRRRRVNKMTMIAEGAEAKRQEDAVVERKRKVEDNKKWEDTREDRVKDWRSFQSGASKKKKRRVEMLG